MLVLFIALKSSWHRNGFPKRTIRVKPASQSTILSLSSVHPPTVHRAWPLARFHHFRNVCSSPMLIKREQGEFLDKMCREAPDHACIGELFTLSDGYGVGQCKVRTKPADLAGMVLPYNPALALFFRHSIVHAQNIASNFGICGPKPCWRKVGPNLTASFKKRSYVAMSSE